MEIEDELLSENLAIADFSGPRYCLVDIDLFGLIEVGACGNPGLLEPLLLLRRQGCRIIRLCEEVIQWESQRFRSVTALAM